MLSPNVGLAYAMLAVSLLALGLMDITTLDGTLNTNRHFLAIEFPPRCFELECRNAMASVSPPQSIAEIDSVPTYVYV